MSLDGEIDEKMRLINDIKKLQAQILTSDKVEGFLKRFDHSNLRQTMDPSPISPMFERATEVVQQAEHKKNPLFDRMSKKLE